MMEKTLKVYVKTSAFLASSIRTEEKKLLHSARYMKGSLPFRKKHAKGAAKPEPRDIIYKHPENAAELSDDFYEKYQNLRDKRVKEVRKEARCVHLAYAFARGVPYPSVEMGAYSEPQWNEVYEYVKVYSFGNDPRLLAQQFEEWKQEGMAYWKRVGNLNGVEKVAKAA